MYAIINTHAGTTYPDGTARGPIISRHRLLRRAIEAESKFQRDVKRANGQSAYLPTQIITIDGVNPNSGHADGPIVDRHAEEYLDAAYEAEGY